MFCRVALCTANYKINTGHRREEKKHPLSFKLYGIKEVNMFEVIIENFTVRQCSHEKVQLLEET